MTTRLGMGEILAVLRNGELTKELTKAEVVAWLIIRAHEGKAGGCTASEETLAAAMGIAPRNFRNLKARLIEKGYIESHRRGPHTPLVQTRLPLHVTKDRTLSIRPRQDAQHPGNGKRQDACQDARQDACQDAQHPPRDGVNGGGTPRRLSENAAFAVARKMLRDGNGWGFGAYREASFLAKRAQLYGVPEGVLREAYVYAERHRNDDKQQCVEGTARVLLSRLGDGR